MMIDIGRDVKAFQAACRAQGVSVGRPFPPLDSLARVSIGTMDEMHRAVEVIGDVLRAS
jgi:histidinol-phosphate aminotransferase